MTNQPAPTEARYDICTCGEQRQHPDHDLAVTKEADWHAFVPAEGTSDSDVRAEVPMTTTDLKAILERIPNEVPIVMSSDPEGNSYLRLWSAQLEPTDEFELQWGEQIRHSQSFMLRPG